MDSTKDSYKTLAKTSKKVLFKDRNSKFYGIAFPVSSEEEINRKLQEVKVQHSKAGHFCYAWQLGKEELQYRVNDDGEPTNSAGMPIYGQIQSFGVTNVFIVVLRYFGGVKLGVGGLIQAYKTTSQMALETAKIVTRSIDFQYEVSFSYPEMNKVMRVIKENNWNIIDQKLELDCKIYLSVRKGEAEKVAQEFAAIYKIDLKKLPD